MITGKRTSIAFVVACITAAACTLYSVSIYAAMVKSQQRRLSTSVELEDQTFNFVTDRGCAGYLSFERVKGEELIEIIASGTFSVKYRSVVTNILIEGQASFNSLDQLSASLLRFTVDNNSILLGTLGINPIKLISRVEMDGSKLVHSIPVPGPLYLRPLSDGKFSLEYHALPNLSAPLQMDALKRMLPGNLRIVPSKKGSCDKMKSTPLQVDSTMSTVFKAAVSQNPFSSFIAGQ